MAIKIMQDGSFKLNTLVGGGGIQVPTTLVLGDGSERFVSTICVHIVDTGAFAGSIIVKGRSRNTQASIDGVVFQPIPYCKQFLNGAAGDGSLVNGVAITTTSIIMIPASGLQVALDLTAFTGGTATVYWVPLEGAAA
jgi:hypothetical protein